VLELEAIVLREWLEELIEPFQERTQSRQQTLRVNIAPGLSVWTSDRASLSRILAELLNNACKYTPPGETIDLAVQPVNATKSDSTTSQGHLLALPATRLRLSVCNTGVEIPPQALPHIFEKFYRIPGGDLWKQGGTGLGLALVQKLAEHIGATIQVESCSNRTCFVVEL
jgi:signal transduction histidine kinase